jgi:hypothetical protein
MEKPRFGALSADRCFACQIGSYSSNRQTKESQPFCLCLYGHLANQGWESTIRQAKISILQIVQRFDLLVGIDQIITQVHKGVKWPYLRIGVKGNKMSWLDRPVS